MIRIRIHTSDKRLRIREAQKHVDPVDPDPKHCYFVYGFRCCSFDRSKCQFCFKEDELSLAERCRLSCTSMSEDAEFYGLVTLYSVDLLIKSVLTFFGS